MVYLGEIVHMSRQCFFPRKHHYSVNTDISVPQYIFWKTRLIFIKSFADILNLKKSELTHNALESRRKNSLRVCRKNSSKSRRKQRWILFWIQRSLNTTLAKAYSLCDVFVTTTVPRTGLFKDSSIPQPAKTAQNLVANNAEYFFEYNARWIRRSLKLIVCVTFSWQQQSHEQVYLKTVVYLNQYVEPVLIDC